MSRVLVIGGGLFGSVISRKLRVERHDVTIADPGHKTGVSGSGPAACLIKPSWVSSLGKDVVEPSLRLLDELYGVVDIQFQVGLVSTTVHWVDPKTILSEKIEPLLVNHVDGSGNVTFDDGVHREFDHVIIAAGVWANTLTQDWHVVEGLSGRAGVAWTWEGEIERPFIRPWAPYRQMVAFNRAPGEIWVGDGTSIITTNWTDKTDEKSLERCSKAIGRTDIPRRHFGIRPYVPKAKPCYLERPAQRVWVATGGAKNGTLAAAWCAHRISGALR